MDSEKTSKDEKTFKRLVELFHCTPEIRFIEKNQVKLKHSLLTSHKEFAKQVAWGEKRPYFYQLQGKKDDFLFTWNRSEELNSKVIELRFFLAPDLSQKTLSSFLSSLGQLDKRYRFLEFYLPTHSRLKAQLLKKGAITRGLHLYGKTNRYHRGRKQLEFKDATQRDLPRLANLEYLAHQHDKTSRCFNRLNEKEYLLFYKDLLKNKHKVFFAFKEDDLIGVLAYRVNSLNTAHIMTIAIHPSFQGQGFSEDLYLEFFRRLKTDKVKVYSGVTTTRRVLQKAKKMGREVCYEYLMLDTKLR